MAIIGQLLLLLCRSGCSIRRLTASLTYVPPTPPYYTLREEEDQIKMELRSYLQKDAITFDIKVFMMKTSMGESIPGFYFQHPEAEFTLLFSHGNATDCGAMREFFIHMCQILPINVFAYDYTGYGASTGSPSERATYADIDAAYDQLIQLGINPSHDLIVYGQSVGSGPSCYIASQREIRALILHSPIMSGLRVLTSSRLLGCFDIYPNIDRIQQVSVPVMIIHGTEDREVPCSHGLALYDAVPSQYKADPWWVEGAGHNDIVERNPEAYFRKLSEFLRNITNTKKKNPLSA